MGLSGRVTTTRRGVGALGPGPRQRLGQQCRVGDAAGAGRHVDPDRAAAEELDLRGVGDPRRPGQHDVARLAGDDRREQRLAARGEHDLVGPGGRAASGPVAGDALAGGDAPGHRAVGVALRTAGQGLDQAGVHRQPGLTEAEVQHVDPGGAQLVDPLVEGEVRRDPHRPRAARSPHTARTSSGSDSGCGSSSSTQAAVSLGPRPRTAGRPATGRGPAAGAARARRRRRCAPCRRRRPCPGVADITGPRTVRPSPDTLDQASR